MLVELRVGGGEDAPRLDCRVDVDAGASVGDLRRALAAHAAERGIAVPGGAAGAVLYGAGGEPLDDDRPVAGAASVVVSGQRLWLAAERPAVDPVRSPAVGLVDDVGTVPFNRTPYRPVAVRARALPPLPAPPAPPRPSRVAITSFVVPLATGIGFAVVFGRPQFLVISLLAPLALGAVALVQRRQGRRSHRRERAEHLARLDAALAEVEEAKAAELADRHQALPPLAELAAVAAERRRELWGRDRTSPDVLALRLGTATLPSRIATEVETGGDDDLRREAEQRLAEAAAHVVGAPVLLDLERAAVVGLHGDADAVDGLARSLLAQVAVRHGPEDVVVAALVGPRALAAHEWLRWLPHVRSSASPIAGAHLAAWPDDVTALLGVLLDVVADRTAGAAARGEGPRLVVVVHEDAAVDRSALGRLLDAAPAAGVRVLWVGRDEALLPRQCRVVVHVSGDAGLVTSTDPDVEALRFTPELASVGGPGGVDAIARHLAPLRDVSSVSQASALPAVVELADVVPSGPDRIVAAWEASKAGRFEGLAATVGTGPGGPFVLDLVEHGPHALVAGTSGAGKSELLQTLVAALAAAHPPEHVTFLFVDYKGGAAAAPFAALPHTVGSVTNLDDAGSRRALVSLRAELDRRMALLAEAGDGASDLVSLARTDPERCPPRLVIVVDEFATLATEIPEFVAGVVDIAQRGRSLGIHLVLATQRPAGVVNERIRANTNLRIALRVLDVADSQNVIGSPEAAAIPVLRRGRGFARLGPTELMPFQVAWAGAPRVEGDRPPVRVEPLGFGPTGGSAGVPSATGTQLDDVLAGIAAARERTGGDPPRRPWLPALPPVVRLEPLLAAVDDLRHADPGRLAVLGLHDDPARQAQRVAAVDLEHDGGLAVFGTGGSGRTTALRTAVASLVAGSSTADVEVVAFDFAGRTLSALADLPHTAVVATADDLETAAREIEHLAAEVDRRRALLGEHRVDSLSALRAQADPAARGTSDRQLLRLPRVAVVVDGFAGLRAELDTPAGYEWLQLLQRVLVDGRQVGIHALVSADRRADLPGPLLTAIGARLVLRATEPDAMVALGVPLALARSTSLPPGRGFLHGDHEVQVAVLGDDPGAAEQAAKLVALAPPDQPTVRRGPLPDGVTRPKGHDDGLTVAIGVGDDGPVVVDLAGGHLLIVGPPGSGRTTTLAAVAAGLRATGTDPAAVHGRAAGAADELERVVQAPSGSREHPRVVLVDDADELGDGPAGRLLEQLAATAGTRLVAAADSSSVARAFSGWVPAVRRGRRVLVLQPASAAEVDQLAGIRMRLRPGARFVPGRGVLVQDRRPSIVQVGQAEGS